jgi:Protein of unknown function (DUF1176)
MCLQQNSLKKDFDTRPLASLRGKKASSTQKTSSENTVMPYLKNGWILTLLYFSSWVQATPAKSLSFSHHDWELACDNTRTCRAAGYQRDADELSLSMLLTRKAGPHQSVTGQLMIGQYGESEALNHLPSVFKLAVRINGQQSDQAVVMRQDKLVADLSSTQVAALVAALLHTNSQIVFTAGSYAWHLSDQGAAAVLLKMDEFQGRVGTRSALVKKGTRAEEDVLPPLPSPVVMPAALLPARQGDEKLFAAVGQSDALRKALFSTTTDDDCPLLMQAQSDQAPPASAPSPSLPSGQAQGSPLTFRRLSNTQYLVSGACWSAAYNSGTGYWVIDSLAPPFQPVLVTLSGTDGGEGTIHAAQKGRGLGDCWSIDDWTWNGKAFIHTGSSTTGMCKLIAPGGAWVLPTVVTKVRRPSR